MLPLLRDGVIDLLSLISSWWEQENINLFQKDIYEALDLINIIIEYKIMEGVYKF